MRTGWLVRLYPARWRARYGTEFRALLDDELLSPSLLLDVIRGAIGARAMAYPASGGDAMNHHARTQAAASLLAVLLVLPAVTFLAAAVVRLMQPQAHEPSRTAWAIFDFFITLPQGAVIAIMAIAPVLALVLGLAVTWRRLASDEDTRADVRALADGIRRVARHPSLVGAAFAAGASAIVLVVAVEHAIAG